MHQALEMLRRLAGAFDDARPLPPTREIVDALHEVTDAIGGRPTSLIEAILRMTSDPKGLEHPDLLISLVAQQFGILGGGAARERGLIERLAMQGEHAQAFAILLDGLAGLARTPAELREERGHFGRYALVRKLACSSPEVCHLATTGDQWEQDVFVRTFPRERLTDALIGRLRRWMRLRGEGIASPIDFGVIEHRPYLASQYVAGIDLRRLEMLKPSLPIVLALSWEAMSALAQIHAQGEIHGHLTRGRIRIEALGTVKLCLGTSELPLFESEERDRASLVRLLLTTAIDDPKLAQVLQIDDREALMIAADRLTELHPEMDELIAAVLWKETERDPLLAMLTKHVTREQALTFIGRLVEDARAV